MILRKLKTSEHLLTRPLWEQIFTEDSNEFLDYYYRNKTKNNEIYVIETDGVIRSMLQLNPYVLNIEDQEKESRYIVAVATEILHRGKGYMTELLKKSVRDMYTQKIPFTFLMPASEKIYYPHHFRYVYDADVWKASGVKKHLKIRDLLYKNVNEEVIFRMAEAEDCKRAAQFASRILKERYQVYTKRDWLYYENVLREQKSMNGGILLAEKEGEIQGMLLFEEEDELTVREPLFAEGCEHVFESGGLVLKKEETRPMIMARVVHAEELLSCMKCSEETGFEFILVDPVIRENNKLFFVKGNSERVVVRTKPWVRGKYEDVQKISIDALTSVLFGYKTLEKIEEEEQETFSAEFKEAISKIEPLKRVFINEIV